MTAYFNSINPKTLQDDDFVREEDCMVKFFIECGADVNSRNLAGFAPIFRALGNVEMLRLLIPAGAEVNSKTSVNNTSVLMEAVSEDEGPEQRYCVEELLRAGADVSHRSEDGDSLLHWIVRTNGRRDVAEILISAGAEVDAFNDFQETPLAYAVHDHGRLGDNLELMECFLKAGASPTRRISERHPDPERSRRTILEIGRQNNDPRMKELLQRYTI